MRFGRLGLVVPAAVGLAIAGLLVAGCGSETARSAAEEELPADETSSDSSDSSGFEIPESSIVGQLTSNLGVNICVTNSSSKNIKVTSRNYDTGRGLGVVAPGSEACAEGTSGFNDDVWLDVQAYNDRVSWIPLLIGNNPTAFAAPRVYVNECMSNSGYDVGESRYWDSGIIAFDIKREADSGWKQFRVNITDSPNPLPPNTTPPCWGPSGT